MSTSEAHVVTSFDRLVPVRAQHDTDRRRFMLGQLKAIEVVYVHLDLAEILVRQLAELETDEHGRQRWPWSSSSINAGDHDRREAHGKRARNQSRPVFELERLNCEHEAVDTQRASAVEHLRRTCQKAAGIETVIVTVTDEEWRKRTGIEPAVPPLTRSTIGFEDRARHQSETRFRRAT